MREILDKESDAIKNIPYSPDYDLALDLLEEHVLRRGGKLVTSGMGKAGQIAMNIATTFSSTGAPAVFLHPSEAQHGDLGVLQPDDVMLLISNSGKTREILELVTLARNLIPDVPIIVITGPQSEQQRKLHTEYSRQQSVAEPSPSILIGHIASLSSRHKSRPIRTVSTHFRILFTGNSMRCIRPT